MVRKLCTYIQIFFLSLVVFSCTEDLDFNTQSLTDSLSVSPKFYMPFAKKEISIDSIVRNLVGGTGFTIKTSANTGAYSLYREDTIFHEGDIPFGAILNQVVDESVDFYLYEPTVKGVFKTHFSLKDMVQQPNNQDTWTTFSNNIGLGFNPILKTLPIPQTILQSNTNQVFDNQFKYLNNIKYKAAKLRIYVANSSPANCERLTVDFKGVDEIHFFDIEGSANTLTNINSSPFQFSTNTIINSVNGRNIQVQEVDLNSGTISRNVGFEIIAKNYSFDPYGAVSSQSERVTETQGITIYGEVIFEPEESGLIDNISLDVNSIPRGSEYASTPFLKDIPLNLGFNQIRKGQFRSGKMKLKITTNQDNGSNNVNKVRIDFKSITNGLSLFHIFDNLVSDTEQEIELSLIDYVFDFTELADPTNIIAIKANNLLANITYYYVNNQSGGFIEDFSNKNIRIKVSFEDIVTDFITGDFNSQSFPLKTNLDKIRFDLIADKLDNKIQFKGTEISINYINTLAQPSTLSGVISTFDESGQPIDVFSQTVPREIDYVKWVWDGSKYSNATTFPQETSGSLLFAQPTEGQTPPLEILPHKISGDFNFNLLNVKEARFDNNTNISMSMAIDMPFKVILKKLVLYDTLYINLEDKNMFDDIEPTTYLLSNGETSTDKKYGDVVVLLYNKMPFDVNMEIDFMNSSDQILTTKSILDENGKSVVFSHGIISNVSNVQTIEPQRTIGRILVDKKFADIINKTEYILVRMLNDSEKVGVNNGIVELFKTNKMDIAVGMELTPNISKLIK